MSLLLRSALLLLALGPLVAAPEAGVAEEPSRPWRGPDFEVEPEVLMQACADSMDRSGSDVLVLLQEHRLRVDGEGRRTIERRLIYQIRTQAGREGWDSVSAQWARWHEARPELDARVIRPDGTVTRLDPSTISEQAANPGFGGNIYDDLVVLSAPLPDLRPGCIVEEVTRTREERPFFEAGTISRFAVGRFMPVVDARVLIEAPPSLPLKWVLHELDASSVEETFDEGLRQITVELGHLEPADLGLMDRLAWSVSAGEVLVSTGENWGAVARAYAGFVEATLADFAVPQGALEIVEADTRRDEKVSDLLAWMRENIRYTGIFFGNASIRPWPPDEVLRRGFGDCKDQSTLLTGLLRAAGLEADVALLLTAPDVSVPGETPGLGMFDHAIVHVGGDDPLWIDPTVTWLPVGIVPPANQGRNALICDEATTSLVRTPVAPPDDNSSVEVVELSFDDIGYADVVEITRSEGWAAAGMRDAFFGSSEKTLEEQLRAYVTDQFVADSLLTWEFEPSRRAEDLFELRLEASGAAQGFAAQSDALLRFDQSKLYSDLPTAVKSLDRLEPSDDPRYPDLVRLPETFRRVVRYQFVPPPGFIPRETPESFDERFGPVRVVADYRTDSETGHFIAELVTEVDGLEMNLDEARSLAEHIESNTEISEVRVYFDHEGALRLAEGDAVGAAAFFRREIEERPDDVEPRVRLADTLLQVGLGERAREVAHEAVEIDSESAYAQRVLAAVLSYDEIGRQFAPGMERDGAIEAARRALELNAEEPSGHWLLGQLLERGEDGTQGGHGADLDAAVEEYVLAVEGPHTSQAADRVVLLLGEQGKWEKLRELADAIGDEATARKWRAVAAAMLDGVDAAAREARRGVDADQERVLLREVAQSLMQLRYYSTGADVFERGMRGVRASRDLEQFVRELRGIRRHEEIDFDVDDPSSLLPRMMLTLAEPEDEVRDALRNLVDPYLIDMLGAEVAIGNDQVVVMSRAFVGDRDAPGFSLGLVLDFMLSNPETEVESDGWISSRVQSKMSMFGESSEVGLIAVERNGRVYLGGMLGTAQSVGLRALEAVDEDRPEISRAWIERMGLDLQPRAGDVLENSPLARLLLDADLDNPAHLKAFALAMVVQNEVGDKVLDRIEDETDDARDQDDTWLQSVLLQTLYLPARSQGANQRALEAARALVELHPDSGVGRSFLVASLISDRELDEAEQLLAAEWEDQDRRRRLAADLALARGDLEGTVARLSELIEDGDPVSGDYNNLAWYKIVQGRVDDEVFGHALDAMAENVDNGGATLHTLACAYAERGRLLLAQETLLEGLEAAGLVDPNPNWRLVRGLVAERVGELEFARDAYRDTVNEDRDQVEDDRGSIQAYAARKLRALDGS